MKSKNEDILKKSSDYLFLHIRLIEGGVYYRKIDNPRL